MILGRVIGTIVSTLQHPFLDGRKLLLVERTSAAGEASGAPLIALDAVDAGPGQTVLVIDEGNSARQILSAPDAPVRSVIVGIVDQVDAG